jgi:hypothetical protein
LVGAISVAVVTGIFALISSVITKGRPPADYVAYVHELAELQRNYKPAQLDAALSSFTFGAYEKECGPAGRFTRMLNSTAP